MGDTLVKLLAVNDSGDISGLTDQQMDQLPEMVQQISSQMVEFYLDSGFQKPWIAYVSVFEDRLVGGGAFKSVPFNGQVEIAFYTLPEFENQGMATATAQALIDSAIQADEELQIMAQTLPEKNASNHLLQKLGFTFFDVIEHPEDGLVWEWHLF